MPPVGPHVNPYSVPWDELPAPAREANLAAALRMHPILAMAGLALRDDPDLEGHHPSASAMLTANLERMAEAEHQGWCQQKLLEGWSWADVRDDALLHHPSLKPYADLPESEKDKDRGSILHYPGNAAAVGLRLAPVAAQ